MNDKEIKKIIDDIVWWIPSKNLRNNIRKLLINNYIVNNKINELLNITDNLNNEVDKNINYANSNELNIIKNNLNILNTKINNYIINSEKIRRINELTTYNGDYYYKKRVFKENVRLVEIGISSFCNRKCWFCPNSIIDRNSCNIELNEDLFLKLLNELREVNYSNYIYLHRYNEPLYNKELLIKRIKQVREYLPQAYIYIVTNGDYLTLDYLKILESIGVKAMGISYYYNGNDKNIPFDIENIIKPGMQKLLNKLNLKYLVEKNTEDYYGLKIEYKDMNIEYRAYSLKKYGTDRGGILKNNVNIINRIEKCFLPNFQIVVDYDANYTLCCNIRSDDENNKNYILGNIETHSVFDIFMGEKTINFRKELLLECPKKGACAHCSDTRPLEGLEN